MKYFVTFDKNVAKIFQLQWNIENDFDIFLQYSMLCGKHKSRKVKLIFSNISKDINLILCWITSIQKKWHLDNLWWHYKNCGVFQWMMWTMWIFTADTVKLTVKCTRTYRNFSSATMNYPSAVFPCTLPLVKIFFAARLITDYNSR